MPVDVEKADVLAKHSTEIFAPIDSASKERSNGENCANECIAN